MTGKLMSILAELRVKDCIRRLHAAGIYPGPTAINIWLGRKRVHMNQLNGKETRWRREVMRELGILLQRPDAKTMMEDMYSDSDIYTGW